VERKAPGSYFARLAAVTAAFILRDAESLGAAPKERVAGPFVGEVEDACVSCIGGGEALDGGPTPLEGGDDVSA
jgi:hypothetical protein